MPSRVAVIVFIVAAMLLEPFRTAASVTICHRVNGRGNTGNGYNLITVNDHQLERHRNHPADLIPAPNGFCIAFPPTTTRPPTTPPHVTQPPQTTVPPPGGTNPPPNGTRPPTSSPPPGESASPGGGTTTSILTGILPPSQ